MEDSRKILEQIYGVGEGVVLHEGIVIRSCQRWRILTSVFYSNLKGVNLKTFVNHEGIYS